ncbi:MAG: CBS domain-containing protein [Bacillota bacterium]|nr:CBS domain-containing protein [Bacillota bacterium]
MFVRDVMTPVVTTVSRDDTLFRAAEIMRDTGYESLVAVKEHFPLGVVSLRQIALFRLANPAVTLEQAYVREILQESPVTTGVDEVIEAAAFKLYRNDLDALPVVHDETGKLAGIVTTSDVLRAFIFMLGLRSRSTRITVEVPDIVGMLADVCQIVRSCGISIASLATFTPAGQDVAEVVLRVKTPETTQLVRRLNNAGFKVGHVSHVWE